MNSREGQLGSFSKKYTQTCKEGQFKRQVAMQMINKHDSPSSHLINRATTGIRHKWSMNLRMDWECLSVFKKPDGSPAGRHSLSCFVLFCFFCVWWFLQGLSECVPTGLTQTIQRTAVNSTTESQQSTVSMPCDLYRKSTKMYECSKKSEEKNMITFLFFHGGLNTFWWRFKFLLEIM